MTETFLRTDIFMVVACCECHVPFGMSNSLYLARREDGGLFHCPNGHAQHFTTSDKQKREKELQELGNRLANRELELMIAHSDRVSAERKAKIAKNKLKRTETRIANGVCPCCNRQFINLHRHMEGQHPDYKVKA